MGAQGAPCRPLAPPLHLLYPLPLPALGYPLPLLLPPVYMGAHGAPCRPLPLPLPLSYPLPLPALCYPLPLPLPLPLDLLLCSPLPCLPLLYPSPCSVPLVVVDALHKNPLATPLAPATLRTGSVLRNTVVLSVVMYTLLPRLCGAVLIAWP